MNPRLQPKTLKEQASQDSNKLNLRNEIQEQHGTRAAPWFEWVFDHLNFPEHANILELGCGTGMFWQANQKHIPAGWKMILSDMDHGLVSSARTNLNNIPQITQNLTLNGQALPFRDRQFDVVLAVGLLDLVPDLGRALGEVCRVLRSDGQFVTTAGGNGHLREMEELVQPFVPEKQARLLGGNEQRFGLENGRQHLATHFDAITLDKYRDKLVFTNLQPVLDYIFSEQAILQSLSLDQAGQFVQRIKRRLEKHQSIEVTVRKGIFIARKNGIR